MDGPGPGGEHARTERQREPDDLVGAFLIRPAPQQIGEAPDGGGQQRPPRIVVALALLRDPAGLLPVGLSAAERGRDSRHPRQPGQAGPLCVVGEPFQLDGRTGIAVGCRERSAYESQRQGVQVEAVRIGGRGQPTRGGHVPGEQPRGEHGHRPRTGHLSGVRPSRRTQLSRPVRVRAADRGTRRPHGGERAMASAGRERRGVARPLLRLPQHVHGLVHAPAAEKVAALREQEQGLVRDQPGGQHVMPEITLLPRTRFPRVRLR
jgi:hypothetical protein